jgi:glutamine amidotransferase
MRNGTINADGFGAGWYAPEIRSTPARYRRAVPMWTDASFASLAGVVSSTCVLAAVRNATVGMPIEETATAPFTDGQRLLSHNGRVFDGAALYAIVAASPGAPVPDSRCDSALLAALVWNRLSQGKDLPDAMADVVTEVAAADPIARLNLLAVDGSRIVATTWNESLSFLVGEQGVLVASEPDGDEPEWVDVPNRRLLVADTRDVTLSNLISP